METETLSTDQVERRSRSIRTISSTPAYRYFVAASWLRVEQHHADVSHPLDPRLHTQRKWKDAIRHWRGELLRLHRQET